MLNFVAQYCFLSVLQTQITLNQTFMKHFATTMKGAYAAPEVDICTVKVESGFEASLPGVTLNPWESDNDTLEF